MSRPAAALLGLLLSACAGVQRRPEPVFRVPAGAVEFRSEMLRSAFNLLMDRSPSFRASLDAIATLPEPPRIVVSPAEEVDSAILSMVCAGNCGRIASAVTVPSETGLLAYVITMTAREESQALLAGYPQHDLRIDLAVILAHEIYGHLVPAYDPRDPDYPGPCSDPSNDEEAPNSCAIQRENRIRRELGLPERNHYGTTDVRFIDYLRAHPVPQVHFYPHDGEP